MNTLYIMTIQDQELTQTVGLYTQKTKELINKAHLNCQVVVNQLVAQETNS